MKRTTTIRFVMQEKKALKNVLRKLIMTIFSVSLFLGIGQVVYGQQIMHVEEAVADMLASDDPHTFAEGMRLQSLLVDVQPSLYIHQGELTAYGTGDPLKLFCNAISIHELYATNPLFSDVELIEISIDSSTEVPASISLEQMTGFLNLQYVYVKFGYDACGDLSTHCLADILSQVFSDSTTSVVVLYGISVPE